MKHFENKLECGTGDDQSLMNTSLKPERLAALGIVIVIVLVVAYVVYRLLDCVQERQDVSAIHQDMQSHGTSLKNPNANCHSKRSASQTSSLMGSSETSSSRGSVEPSIASPSIAVACEHEADVIGEMRSVVVVSKASKSEEDGLRDVAQGKDEGPSPSDSDPTIEEPCRSSLGLPVHSRPQQT